MKLTEEQMILLDEVIELNLVDVTEYLSVNYPEQSEELIDRLHANLFCKSTKEE